MVIENKPGANTKIGAEMVARAAPDGHTLFVAGGSTIVLNPLLFKQLPYDPAKDFRILTLLTELPQVLVVHPSVPAKSLAEFVTYAKQQGDKINYASVGIGGPLHLAPELFNREAGIRMTHIPYKGSAPALTDLLAGQVQVMFDALSSSLPHIRAGKLRALGVSATERVAVLPDMPTVAESGYPGFRAVVWYGLAVPRAVPEPVAKRLKAALDTALADASLRASLEKLGYIVKQPHDETTVAKFIDEDRARWAKVVTSLKISLD